MNAWTRVNLLLGLLAVGLLFVQLWPTPQVAQDTLTDLSPDRIGMLRVERDQRLVIALQRAPAGWQLVHPRRAPAPERRVRQLLAIAQAPVHASYPAADGLDQYELEQPQAVLQLDQLRLAFGARDPSQRLRYVQAGDRVLVIDDVYFNLLTLPAGHFAAD